MKTRVVCLLVSQPELLGEAQLGSLFLGRVAARVCADRRRGCTGTEGHGSGEGRNGELHFELGGSTSLKI